MSITFFAPEAPELFEEYECLCQDRKGKATPDCHECRGTGKVRFPYHEAQFNVNNGNGWLLQEFLGLRPDYCGEFKLERLPVLKGVVREALGTPETTNAKAEGLWGAGFRPGRVQGYLMALSTLVDKAIEHDSPIVWG